MGGGGGNGTKMLRPSIGDIYQGANGDIYQGAN